MKCIHCKQDITGRSDKLYCDAYCKSAYHHQKRKEKEKLSFYKKVDNHLKLNYKLLKHYNKGGYTTVRKEVLIAKGFNPHFFTHYWKNKKGELYLFCYDYGFLATHTRGQDRYVLVQWQNYMEKG